jgi:hypothetical protein
MPPAAETPPARLWLIFFGDTPRRAWWANVLRPGFRHIAAMSWYAAEQRWVYFDPACSGTVIRILTADEAPALIDRLLAQSSAVLRVASRHDRGNAPAVCFCVGQVKALLGVRSRALTPYGLYRDLLARGAQVVHPAPCVVADPEAAARSVA